MPPENDQPDKISNLESEDKTFLRDDTPPTDALENGLTRQFAPSDREQEETAIQNPPDTEPTRILSDEAEADEPDEPPKENSLRPSRLRFGI